MGVMYKLACLYALSRESTRLSVQKQPPGGRKHYLLTVATTTTVLPPSAISAVQEELTRQFTRLPLTVRSSPFRVNGLLRFLVLQNFCRIVFFRGVQMISFGSPDF